MLPVEAYAQGAWPRARLSSPATAVSRMLRQAQHERVFRNFVGFCVHPLPRLEDCGLVIAPQQPSQFALHLHFVRGVKLRFISSIGGVEPDHALFAVQVFQRGFFAAY